jgi:formyltetrahydrofolate hydrolase
VERQQQKIVGKNIESMVLGKSVFDHKEYRVFLFLGC